MPAISVIVPVYKVEKYLRACVDSILAQTFSDFELILVDDGSPDSCGAMCDEYAERDPRIKVIHQENGGLSAARNAGLEIARGHYVTFIDGDDVISVNFLMTLYRAAENENAEVSVCRFRRFSAALPPASGPSSKVWPAVTVSNTDAICMLYQGDESCPVNACGKLFRSDMIGAARFPVGRLHEDQAFVPLVCYDARRISLVQAQMYHYREREESITTGKFSLKRYDDVWAIDQCLAFFEARGEEKIVAAARDKRQRVLCSYAILAKADGIDVPKEYEIPTGTALRYLRKHVPDDKYSYFLSLVHPSLVRPHRYLHKLEQMLGKSKRR